MKKQLKEFLEYGSCFILTVTPVLILALLLLFVYGTSDSKAGTIQYETINHYDSADEIYTELLVKQHMVKHTHIAEIDGKQPAIFIARYSTNKVRVYGN